MQCPGFKVQIDELEQSHTPSMANSSYLAVDDVSAMCLVNGIELTCRLDSVVLVRRFDDMQKDNTSSTSYTFLTWLKHASCQMQLGC